MYFFRSNHAIESKPAGGQVAECAAEILDATKSANRNTAAMVAFIRVCKKRIFDVCTVKLDKTEGAGPGGSIATLPLNCLAQRDPTNMWSVD
jgi:hypothetical protein